MRPAHQAANRSGASSHAMASNAGLKACPTTRGMVPEQHLVELAPDQFRQPGFGAPPAPGLGVADQLADRHGAEAQVGRKVGRPLDGGVVARRGISSMRSRKSSNSLAAPDMPVGSGSAPRSVGSKPSSASVGSRSPAGGGASRSGSRRPAMTRQVEPASSRQPGALVGREHRKWPAGPASAPRRARTSPGPCSRGIADRRRPAAGPLRRRDRSPPVRSPDWRTPRRRPVPSPAAEPPRGARPWRTIRPPPRLPQGAPSNSSTQRRMNSTRRSRRGNDVQDFRVEDEQARHAVDGARKRGGQRGVIVVRADRGGTRRGRSWADGRSE